MLHLAGNRRGPLTALALALALGLGGCGSKVAPTAPSPAPPRTYRMGFSAIPPRADLALLLAALDLWRTLVVMIDASNGLDRTSEHPALVAKGRSLTEPAVQQVYRAFAVAMDTLLRPGYLGLVAETNLIRAAAPAPL